LANYAKALVDKLWPDLKCLENLLFHKTTSKKNSSRVEMHLKDDVEKKNIIKKVLNQKLINGEFDEHDVDGLSEERWMQVCLGLNSYVYNSLYQLKQL